MDAQMEDMRIRDDWIRGKEASLEADAARMRDFMKDLDDRADAWDEFAASWHSDIRERELKVEADQ